MTEDMTVYGNTSKDTMAVTTTATNIAIPVNNTQDSTSGSIANTIDSLSEDNNTPNTTVNISESNWSTNCINDNTNSNNNTNVTQIEETFSNPDDTLEPIERLEKYSISEIIFHRQVVTRSILETLNDVNPNDVQRVMSVISRLASDCEPSIRAELVEQIPQIGVHLSQTNILPNGVPNNLLPILEHFLTDPNSQVRKMTQNAFVLMLEQRLVQNRFLEEHICPLLIQLTDFSNLDDFRMEAVVMMSKIVRFLGRQLTEKLLLETFIRLCADVSFHVRRVCAANFGEFCSVVGQHLTETVLLPKFQHLCQDSIWGVRKCCADVFVPVALTVSIKLRKDVLSPLFVNLLNDQSRWVKSGAFQSLGPFISTFADPTKTGLYYSDNGVIVIEDHNSNDSGCSAGSESAANSPTDIDVDEVEETLREELTKSPEKRNSSETNEFSHFQYWRVPIPDIDFTRNSDESKNQSLNQNEEQTVESKQKSNSSDNSEDKVTNNPEFGTNLCDDQKESSLRLDEKPDNSAVAHHFAQRFGNIEDEWGTDWRNGHEWGNVDTLASFNPSYSSDVMIVREPLLALYSNSNKSANDDLMSYTYGQSLPMGSGYLFPFRRAPPSQDIIPNDLLEHYLSMTNPINYQIIDPDLCHHCAYSLPAVALTLGRQNWSCIRETYEALASEMQWKVRWTLASSLHQMSQILGSELTTRDLLPIFLSFMKDLDEVRYGILQNLAAFLKLLLRPQQQGILPKISEFLKMDNIRNWRFRHTLALQIIELSEIYTSSEIKEYLFPISLILLNDKVSEVRLAAVRLISVLMKHIFNSFLYDSTTTSDNRLEIIDDLNSQMSESNKWIQRQIYALVCEQLVGSNALPIDLFIDKMLEHLLNLSADNVPNIRLVLARTVANTLWPIAQFRSHLRVQQTLEDLQSDKDKDVRNQALAVSLDAHNECTNPDK